jgi:hypothetical protein
MSASAEALTAWEEHSFYEQNYIVRYLYALAREFEQPRGATSPVPGARAASALRAAIFVLETHDGRKHG